MKLINIMVIKRKSLGITQEQIANILGVQRVQFNRYENEKSQMTLEQYEKVMNYLNSLEEEREVI